MSYVKATPSCIPIYLTISLVQVVILGAFVGTLQGLRGSGKELDIWIVAAWMAFAVLLTAVLTVVLVTRRLRFLTSMCTQLPILVAANQAQSAQLAAMPALSLAREIDQVQIGIAQLIHNAAAAHSRGATQSGYGATKRTPRSTVVPVRPIRERSNSARSWKTAESLDEMKEPLVRGARESPQNERRQYGNTFAADDDLENGPLEGRVSAREVSLSTMTRGTGSPLPDRPRNSGSSVQDDDDDDDYNGSFHSFPGSVEDRALPSARSHVSRIGAESDESNPPLSARTDVSMYSAVSTARSMGKGNSRPQAPDAAVFDPLNANAIPWNVAMAGIADPGGSLFASLLAQIRPGQPLSAVTLPAHILEPRSLLERMSDALAHFDMLRELQKRIVVDPYDRLFIVLKWFFTAFKFRPDGAKKPCNPVLGEVFGCVYQCDPNSRFKSEEAADRVDQQGTMVVLAEQVSHHPPVSALHAEGCGITYDAWYHPKTKLDSPNCAASVGCGNAFLTVLGAEGSAEHHNPQGTTTLRNLAASSSSSRARYRYKLQWPSAYVSGFLAGKMRMELGGNLIIEDVEAKITAVVTFHRKPWVGGDYDRVSVKIKNPEGKATQHSIEGCWHAEMTRYEFDEPKPFLNSTSLVSPRPIAYNVENEPLQSRAVWQYVSAALRHGNGTEAAAEKHKVEQAQRAKREELKEKSELHAPKYFRFLRGVESLHQHAAGSGGTGQGKEALWNEENWAFEGQRVIVATMKAFEGEIAE